MSYIKIKNGMMTYYEHMSLYIKNLTNKCMLTLNESILVKKKKNISLQIPLLGIKL